MKTRTFFLDMIYYARSFMTHGKAACVNTGNTLEHTWGHTTLVQTVQQHEAYLVNMLMCLWPNPIVVGLSKCKFFGVCSVWIAFLQFLFSQWRTGVFKCVIKFT